MIDPDINNGECRHIICQKEPEIFSNDSRKGNFIAIIEKKTANIVWQIGPEYLGSYDYSKKSSKTLRI